jgi:NAD+ kinase
MTKNIHFAYEFDNQNAVEFVTPLLNEIGQSKITGADIIVSIGGDGSLLHAFRQAAANQKVFGLAIPGSNSTGFWTNKGIDTAEILLHSLDAAQEFEITPLKATVIFQDKSTQILTAFNEIMPSEDSGQAMLVNMNIHGAGDTIGPIRIMGDGLIFATAFGSTAINRTYGGASIDIRNNGIAITGKGVYEPTAGFQPVVAADQSQFKIDFLSPKKRPVRIQYDGLCLRAQASNPFSAISIEKDKDNAVTLLLMKDPSTRTFSAITPN